MNRRGRSAAGLVVAMLLALAATTTTQGAKYIEDDTPVFPEAEASHALLYVVRPGGPPPLTGLAFPVLLDELPIGFLKKESYLSAQVEPGTRLLWGPPDGTPHWVVLEPGEAYVLAVSEVWMGQGQLQRTSWNAEDPAKIREMVGALDLTHLTPTPESLEKLEAHAAKHLPKLRENVGPPPAAGTVPSPRQPMLLEGVPLPQTFESVTYRTAKIGFVKKFKSRGTLTVTEAGLEFRSKKDHVIIPVESISSVRQGLLPRDPTNPWVIVTYGPGEEIAGFGVGLLFATEAMLEPVYATILNLVDGQDLPPMTRVERAVISAEQFEAGGAMSSPDLGSYLQSMSQSETIREELSAVEPLLEDHLKENPQDVDALFLQVRLDRVRVVLTPVVISQGERQEPEDPGPDRDPQRTLDRILELDPGNPSAYYWKARLHGLTDPMTGREKDLDRAIEFASLAVRAAPDEVRYREALAFYLVAAGRDGEAMEMLEDLPGHMMCRLLEDRQRLPRPEGAAEQPQRARGIAQTAGLPDYPMLRVSAFVVKGPASDLESFYREHWPRFKLTEMESESSSDGMTMRMLGSELDWEGDELIASRRSPGKKDTEGVMLAIVEVTNPTTEQLEHLPIAVDDVYCEVVILNLRPDVPTG